MRKIIEILGVEEWVKDNKRHSRTYAILEDGSEAVGYGSDYEVGDEVMYYYHKETPKMAKNTDERRSLLIQNPEGHV